MVVPNGLPGTMSGCTPKSPYKKKPIKLPGKSDSIINNNVET